MQYSYYPGCTLKTAAKVLEGSALKTAKALGIELREVEGWQCCGAVQPLAGDDITGLFPSVLSLKAAKEKGEKLVTLCAACHNVIKSVNHIIRTNKYIAQKTNKKFQYSGEGEVIHYLELLRDEIGFQKLSKSVKHPLDGKKIAAYYGCLLLRPAAIMKFDNPENPSIMEDFLEALGAVPVDYAYRTECCGVYLALQHEEIVTAMVEKIINSALDSGAEAIVDACPLCHYNLLELQKKNSLGEQLLPVYYFTQILEEALNLNNEVTRSANC